MESFTFNFNMSADINEELRLAVLIGDNAKVRRFLLSGADPNYVMKRNKNALLHLATSRQVTETLLLHGACVNAADADGETALHHVITKMKDLKIVDLLSKHGADMDKKNNFGLTALHCAVKGRSSLETIRKLLQNGANVNASDKRGNSVLFLVVKYYKNTRIIKELLKFGADINSRSSSLNRFFTPLSAAIHKGDFACAKLLIKATVLKYFKKRLHHVSHLYYFIEALNNPQLNDFVGACELEICRMKTIKINNMFTLFDYVKMEGDAKPLYLSSTADTKFIYKFLIYTDIIRDCLRPCIQRGHLLDKLLSIKMRFETKCMNIRPASRKGSYLNGDCLFKIGEFLSNEDILNFLVVIDKYTDTADYYVDNYL